jgi:GNAT superfamily N-acetyltransferase
MWAELVRDFPLDEVKSLDQLQGLYNSGTYTPYCADAEGLAKVGYGFVFQPASVPFSSLDYFAIVPHLRGRGLGSEFFLHLCELQPHAAGMMFEVQAATSTDSATRATQLRRIEFYRRMGARELRVRYYFPGAHGPIRQLLYFRPRVIPVHLARGQIQTMIRLVYEQIHGDVPNAREILDTFIQDIPDHTF